jgi:hypothetical protein
MARKVLNDGFVAEGSLGQRLPFTQLDGNSDLAAFADYGQHDRIAGTCAIQEQVQVRIAVYLFSVDGDDHVAADSQLTQAREYRAISSAKASLRCGAAAIDALDEHASLNGQA